MRYTLAARSTLEADLDRLRRPHRRAALSELADLVREPAADPLVHGAAQIGPGR